MCIRYLSLVSIFFGLVLTQDINEDKCKYDGEISKLEEHCSYEMASTMTNSEETTCFQRCLPQFLDKTTSKGDKCIKKVKKSTSKLTKMDVRLEESYQCPMELKHCASGVEIPVEYTNELVKSEITSWISDKDLLEITLSNYLWRQGMDFPNHYCEYTNELSTFAICAFKKLEEYDIRNEKLSENQEIIIVGNVSMYVPESVNYRLYIFSSFTKRDRKTHCSFKYFFDIMNITRAQWKSRTYEYGQILRSKCNYIEHSKIGEYRRSDLILNNHVEMLFELQRCFPKHVTNDSIMQSEINEKTSIEKIIMMAETPPQYRNDHVLDIILEKYYQERLMNFWNYYCPLAESVSILIECSITKHSQNYENTQKVMIAGSTTKRFENAEGYRLHFFNWFVTINNRLNCYFYYFVEFNSAKGTAEKLKELKKKLPKVKKGISCFSEEYINTGEFKKEDKSNETLVEMLLQLERSFHTKILKKDDEGKDRINEKTRMTELMEQRIKPPVIPDDVMPMILNKYFWKPRINTKQYHCKSEQFVAPLLKCAFENFPERGKKIKADIRENQKIIVAGTVGKNFETFFGCTLHIFVSFVRKELKNYCSFQYFLEIPNSEKCKIDLDQFENILQENIELLDNKCDNIEYEEIGKFQKTDDSAKIRMEMITALEHSFSKNVLQNTEMCNKELRMEILRSSTCKQNSPVKK